MGRKRIAPAAIAAGLLGLTAGAAGAAPPLGFTPLPEQPQSCAASGIRWAKGLSGEVVMRKGDAATSTANATATSVAGENDMIAADQTGRYLFTVAETGSNGMVTRLDTATGAKTILAQRSDWNRLDPVKWYAPSGTLLIGEEDGTHGSVWQVDPWTGASTELGWLGKMSHEGIAFGTDGAIWEGDENHTGAIYKAVPADAADLTLGGTLHFVVEGQGFGAANTVQDPTTAVAEAFAGGASLFDRPEDFDQRNGRIYFAVTEPPDDAAAVSTPGHPVHSGGVWTVNDAGAPAFGQFVAVDDPALADRTAAEAVRGLQFPDNLAFDPRGNLYIHEDIPDDTANPPTNVHSKQFRDQQDELWVAPDKNGDGVADELSKVADLGNTSGQSFPCQHEWTGGLFVGSTFYVNAQHGADSPTIKVTFPKS